jgi:hypothetical protein
VVLRRSPCSSARRVLARDLAPLSSEISTLGRRYFVKDHYLARGRFAEEEEEA